MLIRRAASLAVVMAVLSWCGGGSRFRADARPESRSHGSSAKASPLSPLAGELAFTRRLGGADGHSEIWTMAADGKRQMRLVGHASGNFRPQWSPDGRRIAFESNRHGLPQIYLIKVDGTGERRLTHSSVTDSLVGWSPDGTRILFTRRRGESVVAAQEIWVIDVARGIEAKLSGNPAGDSDPTWSPDGRKVAFASKRDGGSGIYAMKADGTNQQRLTKSGFANGYPAWSPDGRRIAFKSADGISVMSADGSDQRPVRGTEPNDMFPVWSPDGRKIAFDGHGEMAGVSHGWSDIGREVEIYVLYVAGGKRVRLTANADWDAQPAWSPDGTLIAFTSDRDGGRRIYTIRPDGSDQTRITNQPPGGNQDATWKPLVGTSSIRGLLTSGQN